MQMEQAALHRWWQFLCFSSIHWGGFGPRWSNLGASYRSWHESFSGV